MIYVKNYDRALPTKDFIHEKLSIHEKFFDFLVATSFQFVLFILRS